MLLDRSNEAKANIALALCERHCRDALTETGCINVAGLENFVNEASARTGRKELRKSLALLLFEESMIFGSGLDLGLVANIRL